MRRGAVMLPLLVAIMLLVPLTATADEDVLPSSYRASRKLLDAMPNNYGNRAHAMIRVQSTCIMPISVAVRYHYDPWGTPTNCYSITKDTVGGGGWCISKFYQLPAFETIHVADTGADSWQYTAFMNANRSITWGSGDVVNMNGQPCNLNQIGCFQWSWQATGGFETAYSQSFPAILDCDGYIPAEAPATLPIVPPADESPLVIIIVGSVLAFMALVAFLLCCCCPAFRYYLRRRRKRIALEKKKRAGKEVAPLEDVTGETTTKEDPPEDPDAPGIVVPEEEEDWTPEELEEAAKKGIVLPPKKPKTPVEEEEEDWTPEEIAEAEKQGIVLPPKKPKKKPTLYEDRPECEEEDFLVPVVGASDDPREVDDEEILYPGDPTVTTRFGPRGEPVPDPEHTPPPEVEPPPPEWNPTALPVPDDERVYETTTTEEGIPMPPAIPLYDSQPQESGFMLVDPMPMPRAIPVIDPDFIPEKKPTTDPVFLPPEMTEEQDPELIPEEKTTEDPVFLAPNMTEEQDVEEHVEVTETVETLPPPRALLVESPRERSPERGNDGWEIPPMPPVGEADEDEEWRKRRWQDVVLPEMPDERPLWPELSDPVLGWVLTWVSRGGRDIARDFYCGSYYDNNVLEMANRHLLNFEDLRITGYGGQGSYGRVYKGRLNGKKVAVKILVDVDKVPECFPMTERELKEVISATKLIKCTGFRKVVQGEDGKKYATAQKAAKGTIGTSKAGFVSLEEEAEQPTSPRSPMSPSSRTGPRVGSGPIVLPKDVSTATASRATTQQRMYSTISSAAEKAAEARKKKQEYALARKAQLAAAAAMVKEAEKAHAEANGEEWVEEETEEWEAGLDDYVDVIADLPGSNSPISPIVMGRVLRDADFMSYIRHQNICPMIKVSDFPPTIIMEWCEGGTLTDLLAKARTDLNVAKDLTWAQRVSMALDIAMGVLYLHRFSQPVIHRDLTTRNLLLDNDWRVKVADYDASKILYGEHNETEGPMTPMTPHTPLTPASGGSSEPLSPKSSMTPVSPTGRSETPFSVRSGSTAQTGASTSKGPKKSKVMWYKDQAGSPNDPRWVAPEVIGGNQATTASDAYAFAMVLWELLMWKQPWSELISNPDEIAQKVADGHRPPVPEAVDCPRAPGDTDYPYMDRLTNMLQRCWHEKPSMRPRFTAIVRELRAQLLALNGDDSYLRSQSVNPHSAARPVNKTWNW